MIINLIVRAWITKTQEHKLSLQLWLKLQDIHIPAEEYINNLRQTNGFMCHLL
jgi:hypothetical protein